ncbi:sensor histidine kinase [Draconibacterium halophilum]|uniref:sensor histidine kinase n=1 Tax=Draconibacterium halophilum TaxID=2706887 RepID=UPI0021CEE3C2|nr:ATP-binding protein [Draconibacterium halophilum]
MSNAIKFSNTGGEISIGAEQKKDELIVYVSDNGIGIKAENINKLFRIDHSESTLGTEKEKGTGLGLLLCKELIEMHGGKIWVESKKDTGSSFKFSLPVQ